jgi:hypothetical protein
MPHTIVVANKLAGTLAAMLVAVFLFSIPVAAQSTIKAQLCADSQITISQPPHDGTVNNPLVHFSGTVVYAGQIEVYIDDNYSTQIPLASGATTYASDITIGTGTHTIKLVAIATCSSSSNASSTLVVTYVPAKVTGPTTTKVSENGSKVDSSATVQPQSQLSPSLNNTLGTIGQWLNFKTDNQQANRSQLSFVRGGVLIAGLVLSVFGMASIIVDWFSKVTAGFLLPGLVGSSRTLLFRIFFRVVGIVTVLLSLFA